MREGRGEEEREREGGMGKGKDECCLYTEWFGYNNCGQD